MTKESLIGKKVTIRCRNSWANGEWGTVKEFDGEYYHVALWDGKESLIFERKELRVNK